MPRSFLPRTSFADSSSGTGGAPGGGASVKKMGLLAIVLLGINGIVGSGAFLLPQQIYKDAGFILGLATLLASGIATLVIVFCYADLAGKIPGSGGGWLYCFAAWGRFVGFQVGIFVWFAGLATISTEVAALVRVFRNLVPALDNKWVAYACGAVLIVILAVINLFGANIVQWVDNISSGAKIATALFVVVAGAFFLKSANLHPFLPSDVTTFGEGFDAVKNAYGVTFYLFAGFSFLTIAGNKMKNQQRNLPRALLIVILAVTVIYLAIQFITVGNLGADTAKSTVPVATAMLHAMGEWAYYIVISGTIVSIFGVCFACSFEVPILGASLATQHRLLPPFIGKTNRRGAPVVAIAITAVLSIGMLFTGSYVFLATCVVCASAVQYIPTILAVIKLRKTAPATGAFTMNDKVRWVMVLLALAASSYLFLSFTLPVILVCAVVFGLGLVLYFLDAKRRKDPGEAVRHGAALANPVSTRAGAAVIDRAAFLPTTERVGVGSPVTLLDQTVGNARAAAARAKEAAARAAAAAGPPPISGPDADNQQLPDRNEADGPSTPISGEKGESDGA